MFRKNSFISFLLFILSLLLDFNISSAQPIVKSIALSDSIVNYAADYLGKPYKWAGNSEEGFDCSGFVSFVYGHFNIEAPRSSNDYAQYGTPISLKDCHKGDIILFSGTDFNKSTVGHVGIIISENGEPIRFIHSSSSKKHWGVVITNYYNSGYANRFIGIRRVRY
jgi:cell wall-associated NlpC family hydrolase